MENKRQTGQKYEDLAVEYLKRNNYIIHDRNYFIRGGEIDIIGENEGCLVFIEVKYRSSSKYGSPYDAVNSRKIRNIRNAAKHYIYEKGIPQTKFIRFDVVAIFDDRIELLKNAF